MDKMEFSFSDYDCIGFDLDSTLARYQTENLIKLEYDIISNYLVKERHYPGEFLSKPVDPNFLIKGLIIDDEFGNIVKISADGTIIHATHGTRWLKENEILQYYPSRHREFIDNFVKDPVNAWKLSYHEKMRFSLDYFDTSISLAYARAIDTIEKRCCKKKISEVWPDIIDSLLYMFVADHFHENKGGFYPELKTNPRRYYHKCSQNVLNWLGDLKSAGKKLFLISGAYTGAGQLTAVNTLGENWQDFFEIVIFGARKPGFFTMHRDFLNVKDLKATNKVSGEHLIPGGIYYNGNWGVIKNFLTKMCPISDPKFLYIGDNLIQDIYTPNVFDQMDTVHISEELEAENVFGFTEKHPDTNYLSSTLWGSYFYSNEKNLSYWGYVMKNYSRLYVPSIEYLAKFHINHKFVVGA